MFTVYYFDMCVCGGGSSWQWQQSACLRLQRGLLLCCTYRICHCTWSRPQRREASARGPASRRHLVATTSTDATKAPARYRPLAVQPPHHVTQPFVLPTEDSGRAQCEDAMTSGAIISAHRSSELIQSHAWRRRACERSCPAYLLLRGPRVPFHWRGAAGR